MLFSSCAPVENIASICALNRLNRSRAASGSSTIRIVPKTADDQDGQRLDAEQERKTFDADKGKVDAIQRAGDAGDEGAGDEGEQFVGVQVDAHDACRGVIIPDRDKGASNPASPDVERGEQRDNREAEAEVGKGRIAVETHAQYFRTLN